MPLKQLTRSIVPLCLLLLALLPTFARSQVGPFTLLLTGADGYAFDNFTLALRPIPSSHAAAVVVDKTSPLLTTRLKGNPLRGGKLPSLTGAFTALGPVGGFVPASSLGTLHRQQFVFQNLTDAGSGAAGKAFRKSAGGFELDAIPGRMAYYLLHRVRAGITYGWVVCPGAAGGKYGELFFFQYAGKQPKPAGCYFVELQVVPASSST